MNDFTPTTRISIAMERTEPVSCDAEVIGQWAITVTFGTSKLRDPYSVTHVPTGAVVVKDLQLGVARQLARTLHDSVPQFERIEGEAWLTAAPKIKEVVYGKSSLDY